MWMKTDMTSEMAGTLTMGNDQYNEGNLVKWPTDFRLGRWGHDLPSSMGIDASAQGMATAGGPVWRVAIGSVRSDGHHRRVWEGQLPTRTGIWRLC